MATITIRNLDEEVKRRLRMRGAQNSRSMEAEARAILAAGVLAPIQPLVAPTPSGGNEGIKRVKPGPFDHLVGKWEGRMTTDELMNLSRGEK